MNIIVEIAPDGTTTKTVTGIKGAGCTSNPLSVGLDQVLGKKTTTTKTSEYYARTTTTTRQYQQG